MTLNTEQVNEGANEDFNLSSMAGAGGTSDEPTETTTAVAEEEVDFVQKGAPKKVLGKLSVRPYVTESENMGLEKYSMVVYPGTVQVEPLTCIQDGNIIRYVNGLNEMDPMIQGISNKEKRQAAILDIRNKVSYLEYRLKQNRIDPADPDFWQKVQLLSPDNTEFWETIKLELGNNPIHLDPENKPKDYIKLLAIEAGGFSLVAKSWEDARAQMVPPKWHLDHEGMSVKTRTEGKKIRNRALGILDELFHEAPRKLMLVAKVTDNYGHHYKYSTPPDIIYENMDKWINGESGDKNYVRASQTFLANAELSAKELKLKALCRDAAFYKVLNTKHDGVIYHVESATPVGRTLEEAALFFADPINQDLCNKLMDQIESYWKE